MARKKSELLSALGTTFEIVKALVDEVLNLGGSDGDIRRILKDEGLRRRIAELILVIQDTYEVVVDYSHTLTEMIESCHLDWKNSDIIPEYFPIEGEGCQKVKVTLFHFNRKMSTEQAASEMEEQGYRPATLPELLALGAAQPDLQKRFPILALGSGWQAPDGHLVFPSLRSDESKRFLSLIWFASGWSRECRFLAVRRTA